MDSRPELPDLGEIIDRLDLPLFLDGEQVPFKQPPERWGLGAHFDIDGQLLPGDRMDASWITEAFRQEHHEDCFLKAMMDWHGDLVVVHTSYLGWNENLRSGPPLVWETLIEADYTVKRRYSTRKAAEQAHARITGALVAAGLTLVEQRRGFPSQE